MKSIPLKYSRHGNTGDSVKSRQDPLHQLIFLVKTWNSSSYIIIQPCKRLCLGHYCRMPIIARKKSFLGSGVSKFEEATGFILPGQTH